MKLEGKVALITGASRGIGRAIARLFAEEGARVIINYCRSGKEALDLLDEIMKKGREALMIKADISKADEVKKMVQAAVQKFGQIDILVNNAGIGLPVSFLDSTEEAWNKTLDVNLKGAYLCSKEVAPIMLDQERGRIINISSTAGLAQVTALRNTPYVVSKAGLIGLTRSLAVNLGPKINVNAICPGLTETDQASEMGNEFRRMAIEDTLLKRIAKPEEIANVALFLASDESGFITGEIISVSGGSAMR